MTSDVAVIACMARNGAIGRNGGLLYRIPEDMRRFRDLTMDHPVVMGRKTFESLPCGPLRGRLNVVVTHDPWPADGRWHGVVACGSVSEALETAGRAAGENGTVFVIGGGEVYRQVMAMGPKTIHLTVVDDEPSDADVFFPDVGDGYDTVGVLPGRDRDGLAYEFRTLVRRC